MLRTASLAVSYSRIWGLAVSNCAMSPFFGLCFKTAYYYGYMAPGVCARRSARMVGRLGSHQTRNTASLWTPTPTGMGPACSCPTAVSILLTNVRELPLRNRSMPAASWRSVCSSGSIIRDFISCRRCQNPCWGSIEESTRSQRMNCREAEEQRADGSGCNTPVGRSESLGNWKISSAVHSRQQYQR